MASWFCDRPGLNFLAFAWRGIYMTAKRAVMLVKRVTYFGEFGYLNSSCTRKSIILFFLSSSRDEFTLLQQNSVRHVFVDFWPPCWCPCRWAPAWRLHTNLYNLGKTFLRISRLRNIAVIWILVTVSAYLPSSFFQILEFIYWTAFIFILKWRDTENQQLFI